MRPKLLIPSAFLALALIGCSEESAPDYTGPARPPTPTPPIGCIGTLSSTNETLKGEGFLSDFRGKAIILTTFDNIIASDGSPVATLHMDTGDGFADANHLIIKGGTPGNFQSYAQDVAAYAISSSSSSTTQLRLAFQTPKINQPVWLYTSSGKDRLYAAHVSKLNSTVMNITFEISPDGAGRPGQPIVDANGDVVGIFLVESQNENESTGRTVPLQNIRKLLEAQ